jgi:hypothetical protein
MDFSDIVKRQLKKHGHTQRWLARQLGVTPGAVTKTLYGNPTLEIMRRIDAVLPLPEAAGLLHGPDVLGQLAALTREYSDVLGDDAARADFDALVQAIAELSPQQRRGLLLLLQSSDKPE